MDEQTEDDRIDTTPIHTARMHAQRNEVRAGIPLLLSMLSTGVLAALAARSALSGGIIQWIAMIVVFIITAHATGILYGWLDSTLRTRGDRSEH